MPGSAVITTAALFSAILFLVGAFALHLASIALVLYRLASAGRHRAGGVSGQPGVTLLRPLCGLENSLEETLRSTFTLSYPNYEIIFCVEQANDPVIPLARRLMADYPAQNARLLIGADRISGNPKLNNLVKGWNSAAFDWIVMSDSNVLLPVDYIETLLAHWHPGTGLVSGPAIGIRPDGIWGALECAFLNSYQARWQMAADQLGLGFAQGKNLFWRRDILENGGGLQTLGAEMAEDVASTKLVRRANLKVRVVTRSFAQPIGARAFRDVWQRQLRWARVRRLGFLLYFLPEVLTGGAAPLLAAVVLLLGGAMSLPVLLALGIFWYGAEFLFARAAGWPGRARDIAVLIIRDMMIPALWLAAWAGNGFEWRGTKMTPDDDLER